jgi:antitoxin component YwqK of YwqJK toxin-antitoxin module
LNNRFLIFIFGIIPLFIFGQSSYKIKEIVSLNQLDTLEIKKFNLKGNLIFQKIFPQYGISQILGYSYIDGQKTSYIWSHSNFGFIKTEYEHDTINNTISEYSYEERKIKINNLMNYHSIKSLKSSNEYKEYLSNKNRILESVTYLKDKLPSKKIEYSEDGKIERTIYFIYEKEKLILEKRISSNNNLEELVYEYDTNGNETKWSKIYNSSDTSVSFQKQYSNGKIIKELFYIRGELDSKTIFEYEENLLKSKNRYDKKDNLKIKSVYNYNKDGEINFIDELNNYMNIEKRIYYYYW